MTILRTLMGICLSLLIAAALPGPGLAADSPYAATVQHLQAAHHVETNAEAAYLAFAAKADEEGYGHAASLFRAIARAEQVLYTFHYDAVKELGAVPEDAPAAQPTVGSTKENLEKSASKAAADQLDSDYATYAKTARAEGNRNAAKTFDYARQVEMQNFRLLSSAAKSVEAMRGGSKSYYICGVTGFVSPTLDQANCEGPDWEKVK